MRVAFLGTPEFAVPALSELLAAGFDIAQVYTQPPRPAGRGQKLRKSPIHEFSDAHNLPVRCPENFKDKTEKDFFAGLNVDVAIVVAYGVILPKAILEAPHYGCLNLHASLLPRWRGAAPIQRAIMAGDKKTAIQLMQMEKGLDTGPILLSETVAIKDETTSGQLHDQLAQIGASMLPRSLSALARGGLVATPQTEQGVVYAHKITPPEARIEWQRSAAEIDCHIRGLSPFPGAWSLLADENDKEIRVKILLSRLVPLDGSTGKVGDIIIENEKLYVQAGEGRVQILRLQLAGKKAQSTEDYLRGANLSKTVRFL
ncbi:MAG: methionyl-tRNA formyltransferase [bacterium]